MMGRRAFTLLELLISIVLMMILLAAVTLIFMRATDTVTTTEARTAIYTSARYALDIMQNDIYGCQPFNSGQQRFCLDNGNVGAPGADPTYNNGGSHVGNAADRLIMRATTTVADTLQTCEIEYCLVPGSMALGPAGGALPGSNLVPGDPAKKATIGINTGGVGRPIYTLVRRVRVQDPAAPGGAFSLPAKDRFNNVVQDMELCHYVISFNIEYFANNGLFSNLHPSPCPSAANLGLAPNDDPLGNALGANDTGPTPLRVPMIRITLVIVEDTTERQERAVQKVMWIPMG